MSILRVMPSGSPLFTPDPFLFCAYHRDFFPEGDDKMQAPRRGNGADFNPDAPYRMYHGDRIPGFPQHPHRGFETLTAVLTGMCDHSDSLGSYGRFGNGDLQWMSAGAGVVHGENFPLIHQDKPNTLKLFQIWLNLEAKNKMTTPGYIMNWAEDSVTVEGEKGATAILFAGHLKGKRGGKAPAYSWAQDVKHDVGVYYITLPSKGSSFTLDAATYAKLDGQPDVNRVAHIVEGAYCKVDGTANVRREYGCELDSSKSTVFTNETDETVEILILQGRPIGEPVASRGPFVLNTQQQLMQAFMDYQKTRFGGWPWKDDAVVFPRDVGRFAVLEKDQPATYPSSVDPAQCSVHKPELSPYRH